MAKTYCKYQCNNKGKYFDKVERVFKICPEHSALRSKEVREGVTESGNEVYKLLGFSEDYLTYEFDSDSVITKSQLPFLDRNSVDSLKDELSVLMDNIKLGTAPKRSVTIGLDRQFNADTVAVPLLLNAYKAGLTVAPLVSSTDYRVQVQREDNQALTDGNVENFREIYLNREVVLMVIPSGVSEQDILEAKGLMQARAVKGKVTIFLTSRPKELLSEICAINEEEANRYCSYFMGVRYKSGSYTEKRSTAYKSVEVRGDSLTLDELKNYTAL